MGIEQAAPAPFLLNVSQAATLLGVSVRTFRVLTKSEGFPAPRALGPRNTRWVRSELEAYAVALPAVEEHRQLADARAAKAAGRVVLPQPFRHAAA